MEVGDNIFLKGVIDDIKEKNGKFTATIIVEGKKVKIDDATKILTNPNDIITSMNQLKEYDEQEIKQMFNTEVVGDVISQFTQDEITSKIQAYKDFNKIKVGSLVSSEAFDYIVLEVKGTNLTVLNLSTYTTMKIKSHLVKDSGKVVELTSLLKPKTPEFIVPQLNNEDRVNEVSETKDIEVKDIEVEDLSNVVDDVIDVVVSTKKNKNKNN